MLCHVIRAMARGGSGSKAFADRLSIGDGDGVLASSRAPVGKITVKTSVKPNLNPIWRRRYGPDCGEGLKPSPPPRAIGLGDAPRIEPATPADPADPLLREWVKTQPGPVVFVRCELNSTQFEDDSGFFFYPFPTTDVPCSAMPPRTHAVRRALRGFGACDPMS